MFELVIAILVFGSVSTGVLAVARPRLSAIEARIASLREQVTAGQVSELALPFEERVLAPIVRGFGRVLSNFLPATFLAGVNRSSPYRIMECEVSSSSTVVVSVE